jgi:hypothetical protein
MCDLNANVFPPLLIPVAATTEDILSELSWADDSMSKLFRSCSATWCVPQRVATGALRN